MSKPNPARATCAETIVPAFQVHDLCKDYRLEGHTIPVLRGLSVEIAEGQWVALVGRSGCGKTTLLQLLGCLDKPSAGEILCRGRPYNRMSRRQRTLLRRNEIGFVFQSYHLFPELNALENVLLPALRWGEDRRVARKRALWLLREVGLEDRARHRPRELSGGEQQRVAIARALMNEPDIILADEPTGNLDVEAASEIIQILARIHREQGKTVVMVTHDLSVARLADLAYLLRDGVAAPCELHEGFDLTA